MHERLTTLRECMPCPTCKKQPLLKQSAENAVIVGVTGGCCDQRAISHFLAEIACREWDAQMRKRHLAQLQEEHLIEDGYLQHAIQSALHGLSVCSSCGWSAAIHHEPGCNAKGRASTPEAYRIKCSRPTCQRFALQPTLKRAIEVWNGSHAQPFVFGKLATRIATELFTDGRGKMASRLVMEHETPLDGGGWSFGAIRDQVQRILKEVQPRVVNNLADLKPRDVYNWPGGQWDVSAIDLPGMFVGVASMGERCEGT